MSTVDIDMSSDVDVDVAADVNMAASDRGSWSDRERQ
jgi:hypothetical protein